MVRFEAIFPKLYKEKEHLLKIKPIIKITQTVQGEKNIFEKKKKKTRKKIVASQEEGKI